MMLVCTEADKPAISYMVLRWGKVTYSDGKFMSDVASSTDELLPGPVQFFGQTEH